MPANDWTIGVPYSFTWNSVPWSQPGGPNTTVYPKQVTGNSDYLSTKPYNELTGVFMFGCGHSADQCLVLQDYDYNVSDSVALVCCPLCSCVSRTITPYSQAVTNSLQDAIIYP